MIKKKIDEYLNKALEYYDLPGLAVGIGIREDSTSENRGFTYGGSAGYKDYPTREKLLPQHTFHMASVSKLFVSTSIMQLWEKGLIDIDKPLTHYLPWFCMKDDRYKRITIRQILSHTAALPDVKDYCWDKPEIDEGALERYVKSQEVREAHLLWDPEEGKFSYSNIGYEVLGLVIASLSGLTFEEYVKKNIFKPLNMMNSSMMTAERGIYAKKGPWDEICTPHDKNSEKEIVPVEHFPYNRAHGPSSTLSSNIEDMARWANGHFEQSILGPDAYKLAWTPQAIVPNNGEDICLGWFGRKQEDYYLYGHEGNDDGFRASFWICPQLKAHIIVCSNTTKAPVKRINKEIFQMII